MIYTDRRAARGAILLLSSVATLALAATPAWAADAEGGAAAEVDTTDGGPTEIVVTARHREEKSQDVPVSIDVVDARTLERTGNYTLNQLQQQVPTLQIASFNPRNTNVTIRGLGANSSVSLDGLEYGVGFYVDGVYFGRPAQSQFDIVDLQQIEVLHGPQGTLFGKNTTAGAINITTREPSFTPEVTAEGTLGDYNFSQFRASGSLPIIADKVAIRLSVANTHRDGFLLNAYDGSDAQDYNNFTARGQLLIKPNDDVKIRIIGDYSKQEQHYPLTLIDGYFSTLANGSRIANNIFDRAARTGYTLPTSNVFQRVGNQDAEFRANMKSYGVSGQVDWDLGRATLTSITAYRWWDWDPRNDTDATSLPIMTLQHTATNQRQFSQELRIASNGHNKIDYVAGLYYFWQVVRSPARNAFGSAYVAWNYDPATRTAATIAAAHEAFDGFEADTFANPATKSYAAFGQADWHITNALTLTGGLRFTHEDKSGSFSQFWVSGASASALSAAALTLRNQIYPQVAFSAKLKSDALSGLVTLGYKVTPDILLYGTYSHGSKSGGLNLSAGGLTRPVTDPSRVGVVDPEKVDNFELGFKSQFLDRRVTLNAAAYLTNVRDYQANISQQISPTATIQYLANIPKVRSKGFEASLTYAPSEWFNFGTSVAYTDARYVTYTGAQPAVELAVPGALQDLSGKRLPFVPKFTYSLNFDAAQPLGENLQVYLRGDYLHRSSTNATATLSTYGFIPAYGVVNARIGVRTTDGRYDLSLWARNLTDADYYTNRSGAPTGLITATPGDPRTIGVTARIKL
ncbi:MAG: Pesticin receptor [Novosphingobium sp.]|nr:Pesticin receptor [Novosphingobium sp.]